MCNLKSDNTPKFIVLDDRRSKNFRRIIQIEKVVKMYKRKGYFILCRFSSYSRNSHCLFRKSKIKSRIAKFPKCQYKDINHLRRLGIFNLANIDKW